MSTKGKAMDKKALAPEPYSKDAPFSDPVVRCANCQGLVFTEEIKQHGMCACGHRRFVSVQTFNEREYNRMVQKGVDSTFLGQFAPRGEEDEG